MAGRKQVESTRQHILDIESMLAVAPLPATISVERRQPGSRQALMCRIYREFEEMPGQSLTPVQAAKLFGLPADVTARILGELSAARLLSHARGGRFVYRSEKP